MCSKPTFKYSSSPHQQQPVFRVVEPPLHYSSYAQRNTTFEDLSFSSYVKDDKDDPTNKTDVEDTEEISIFDAQKYFSTEIISDDAKQQDIVIPRISSVSSSVDGYGNNNSKFSYLTRSSFQAATPTASSEASWNSQTGLLKNPPGVLGVSMKGYRQEKKIINNSSAAKKWIFGHKCCCVGQKAVRIKGGEGSDSEHDRTPRPFGMSSLKKSNVISTAKAKVGREFDKEKEASVSSPRRRTPSITAEVVKIHQHKLKHPNPSILSPENNFPATHSSFARQQRVSASGGFSFPVLNQTTKSAVVSKPANFNGVSAKRTAKINFMEDPPRDSIDVFQPSTDNPAIIRLPYQNPGSPLNGRVAADADDDVGSDASSDLFEIESFSTQSNSYPMYRRRDSLDEAQAFAARKLALLKENVVIQQRERNSLDEPPTPSVAATECYAPSEASIAWSVTTAEGFDRASVSNFSLSASQVGGGDDRFPTRDELIGVVWDGNKIRRGNGATGLLTMGCRHEKAVSVGPQPVKYAPVNNSSGGDGITASFPMHEGGRPPRAASNKPPHSARLQLAFAA